MSLMEKKRKKKSLNRSRVSRRINNCLWQKSIYRPFSSSIKYSLCSVYRLNKDNSLQWFLFVEIQIKVLLFLIEELLFTNHSNLNYSSFFQGRHISNSFNNTDGSYLDICLQ